MLGVLLYPLAHIFNVAACALCRILASGKHSNYHN